MTKQRWYKVTRHNGIIEYASKYDGYKEYYLWGSGFGILGFDAIDVEEVDDIPTHYTLGTAYFDDGLEFQALHDKNRWWNGWAMPFIHESCIKRLCDELSDEEWTTYKIQEDDSLLITYHEYDDQEPSIVQPTNILGQTWYYLGNEGLCFNFKTLST